MSTFPSGGALVLGAGLLLKVDCHIEHSIKVTYFGGIKIRELMWPFEALRRDVVDGLANRCNDRLVVVCM
jgi:hypothetical protein